VKNAPNQTRTENSGLSSEALFREFQAWSVEQDARALAAPVVKNAPASVRSVQKQRAAQAQNQSIQNAEEPSFLQSLFGPFRTSPPQRGPWTNHFWISPALYWFDAMVDVGCHGEKVALTSPEQSVAQLWERAMAQPDDLKPIKQIVAARGTNT
jgi:hypothetical protein